VESVLPISSVVALGIFTDGNIGVSDWLFEF